MKILFLDIDGVLNDSNTSSLRNPENISPAYLNPVNIGYLNKIVKETHCNIVIHSTWRLAFDLIDLMCFLEKSGFEYSQCILGLTGDIPEIGVAVHNYLDDLFKFLPSSLRGITKYAILEDCTDSDGRTINGLHKNHVFKTNYWVDKNVLGGINKDVAQKVIQYFLPDE